jgi:hypothetical protein
MESCSDKFHFDIPNVNTALMEEACSHAAHDCRLGDEESWPAPAPGDCTTSGATRNLRVDQVCHALFTLRLLPQVFRCAVQDGESGATVAEHDCTTKVYLL